MADACPLGYECDLPDKCAQFGAGIEDSDVMAAEAKGLKTRLHSGMAFVALCSGPLDHGMNDLARTAVEFNPEQLDEGGLYRLARKTISVTGNLKYMHDRNRINETIEKRGNE